MLVELYILSVSCVLVLQTCFLKEKKELQINSTICYRWVLSCYKLFKGQTNGGYLIHLL